LPDPWFRLSRADQSDALEVAAAQTGRPPHLLEKDVWVVWALSALYESTLADKLTFKGGTSLSKVYKVIDRFSEDIDLTYDIREIVPDLLREGNPIPPTPSQAKKITDQVRARLPQWIEGELMPLFASALARDGLQANLSIDGNEKQKLILAYEPIKIGTGYSAPTIQLEFGGRATGEPNQRHDVVCDIAPLISGVVFPTAQPSVMAIERTFWEKSTAVHVYCLQGRLRGDRFSRHWYDLAAMLRSGHAQSAIADNTLARTVAQHKSMFFAEKDVGKTLIDYKAAVSGKIRLVPNGRALEMLREDYLEMLADGLISKSQPSFPAIIEACAELQGLINK
jgi:hypothetical protein